MLHTISAVEILNSQPIYSVGGLPAAYVLWDTGALVKLVSLPLKI